MIQKLIPDIYNTITSKSGWFTTEMSQLLADDIALRLKSSLGEEREPSKLRLSQMGDRCPRQLWYSIHHPELAQDFKGWERIKFAYGHILEALAITLAKASGHSVTGEQDELELDGVKGHRDCVIDGCIVDVKSSTTLGMQKFKDGTLWQDDKFGYLDQLDGYAVASLEDPLVTVKDKAYILAIDKQLGHMVLYEHVIREQHIRDRISRYREIVSRDVPPPCECGTVAEGSSGNIRLDTKASYSNFKFVCFPNLRTAISPKGPIYFTNVGRWPKTKFGVPYTELDRNGRVVYG